MEHILFALNKDRLSLADRQNLLQLFDSENIPFGSPTDPKRQGNLSKRVYTCQFMNIDYPTLHLVCLSLE